MKRSLAHSLHYVFFNLGGAPSPVLQYPKSQSEMAGSLLSRPENQPFATALMAGCDRRVIFRGMGSHVGMQR
jgi:hypothetical protein